MRPEEEFAPLRIVKKNLAGSDRSMYRVYKSPTEYVSVEAATALEAFRESGIKDPHRIMRETRFMERLVDQGKFSDGEELVETGLTQASNAIASQAPLAQPMVREGAKNSGEFTEAPIQNLLGKKEPPKIASEEAGEEVKAADTLSVEEIDSLLKEE